MLKGGDTTERRRLLQAATALIPAMLAERIGHVAKALTPYDFASDMQRPKNLPTVTDLIAMTSAAKRAYQGSQYTAALDQVPTLLTALQTAASEAHGDALQAIQAVGASAYQVVGSIMLKLGDPALAAIAADRSMAAAVASQNALVIGSSARILTHSLMSTGHDGRAVEIATAAAHRLSAAVPKPSPQSLSVYGALILRGAVAAASAQDRGAASQLLDEAKAAARRLGRDDNAEWTAFGPTNVLLHRVNVAVLLGDAGAAIDLSRQIDAARITLAERRAALYVDLALAYGQLGRLELALSALIEAEQAAPEELQARSSVHHLVIDLAQRGGHRIYTDALELGERIGMTT